MKRFTTLSVALLLAVLASYGLGQETEPKPGEKAPKEAAEVKSSEQKVSVDQRVEDRAIAERIRKILNATASFEDPRVRVSEGVVFLEGRVGDASFVDWATDLANRTENVVAVVNRIEVKDQEVWNVAPSMTELKDLARAAVHALPMILIGLVVLVGTFFASRFLAPLAMKALPGRVENQILRGIFEKAIYVMILFVGIYIFLRISGLTRIAVTLVGGTGVAGLVMGFAFRDIAENFLASILISIQRPFRLGDTIAVSGHQGVVQAVTTRGTVLMDFDGNHVQISNATVYKSTIQNFTANPKRRINFGIGIGYDASIADAQAVLKKVLEDHSAVLADPTPRVLVEELAGSTVNLRVYAWIDGTVHGPRRVQSSLMRLSTVALIEAGISMPDEAREVIFPEGVPLIRDVTAESLAASGERSASSPKKPVTRPAEQSEHNAGEGSLVAEEKEIKEQAEQNTLTEDGTEVLLSQEDEKAAR